MGCKPSQLQIQHNGDLVNEDTHVRKRFLTGIHVGKGKNGLEGNLQVAYATTRVKKYEKVANISPLLQETE